MPNDLNAEFFRANRQSLRELYKKSNLIIVAANGLLQRGADSTFTFSQDANFWYLTGINEPDLLLVMDGAREYLIVPERSISRQAFDGAISQSKLKSASGISEIYDETGGWGKITKRIKKDKKVGILGVPSLYLKVHGIFTNPARIRLHRRLQKLEPLIQCSSINDCMRDLRMIKQPAELKIMQKAIDITIDTLKEGLHSETLKDYQYEYQIEANITKGFRSRGAQGHAYEPIVASGTRGCTLHYIENNGKIGKNELVVIDVGAEVDHYAADITRTISLGKPTQRMVEVHGKVLEVHKYACSLLKPGVLMRDYETKVNEFLGKKLVELGLMDKPSREETIKYYPHATSHFLGLNVHDVGNYSEPLKPGMVLTIEPGIYIKEEGIGIRIEDDALITENGLKILSDKMPRQLTMSSNE